MAKSRKTSVNRRNFLKSTAVGAAALVAKPAAAKGQPVIAGRGAPPPPMSPEAEAGTPSNLDVQTMDRSGSDFMVDVIKSLGFEYIVSNPGSHR